MSPIPEKFSGYVCQQCGTHFETPGKINADFLVQIIETLAEEGNEAAYIAQNSASSHDIRRSQLRDGRDKVADLDKLKAVYTFIKSTNYDGHKLALDEIEAEIL